MGTPPVLRILSSFTSTNTLMPADNTSVTPVEAPEVMHRNRTKITQIVYPKGNWDKRIVPPGHTVCLTEAYGKKFARLFELVQTAPVDAAPTDPKKK